MTIINLESTLDATIAVGAPEFTVDQFEHDGTMEASAFASDLGLAPCYWPQAIVVVNGEEGILLRRNTGQSLMRQVDSGAVDYRTGNFVIRIFND